MTILFIIWVLFTLSIIWGIVWWIIYWIWYLFLWRFLKTFYLEWFISWEFDDSDVSENVKFVHKSLDQDELQRDIFESFHSDWKILIRDMNEKPIKLKWFSLRVKDENNKYIFSFTNHSILSDKKNNEFVDEFQLMKQTSKVQGSLKEFVRLVNKAKDNNITRIQEMKK